MSDARQPRSGRRKGLPDTRTEILNAARGLFARDGFDRTTIRGVAAAAAVDPALIHHYFGTKRQLFLDAIALPVDPAQVLGPLRDVAPEALGETIVRLIIDVWDGGVKEAGVAALKAQIIDPTSSVLRPFVSEILTATLAIHVQDNAQTRIALAASQIGGLLLMRYVIELEPLTTMTAEELAIHIGPTIQRYLTHELPIS